jgi:F-box protein 11
LAVVTPERGPAESAAAAGQLGGVVIMQGGDSTVRNCQIHHNNKGGGVLVWNQGKGTVEDCDIFANNPAGVVLGQGGDPTVRNCR